MTAVQTRPRTVSVQPSQSKPEHQRLHAYRVLDPVNTTAIALLHVGAVGAFFLPFHWYEVAMSAALWWLCGGLGVCLCYHRLLTHRSFKTPKFVEYVLTLLGTTCWQGGPIKWVGTHRIHHKHSDDEGDPHSPHHGFNWAHILWCLMKEPPGYMPREAAKDLQRDPVMVWIDRYHYVPQMALAVLLLGIGWLISGPMLGLSLVVWGVCIRTIFTFHATWFVNSAAHTWGYQSHETGDDSKNNWWVALLSFGEGWHNNHHAAQRAAAHGRRWWEVDMTYWTIKAMSWVGLAHEIVPVKA